MKATMLARITIFLLVAVLSLGPVVSFAAPIMGAEQDTTSKMAMSNMATSGGQSVSAQAGCTGCTDAGKMQSVMGANCNVICLSPVMLPTGLIIEERTTAPHWTIASGAESSGIITGVDPYPPNFSS
jgi:hypothetical protein